MELNFREVISTFRGLLIFVTVIVPFLYLFSLSGSVRKFIYKQRYSWPEKFGLALFFGFLGILASEYGVKLIGVVVNARDFFIIFAGIFGGPAVGIGAGLIAGLYRATGVFWDGWTGNLGYWSAVGCGVATIGAGFLGAWLAKYKNFNIRAITVKQIWQVAGLNIIWEFIHIHVFVGIISPLYTDKTFWWIQKSVSEKLLAALMALVNAVGILLFLFIARDLIIRKEAETALEEIKRAEKEIEQLKKG